MVFPVRVRSVAQPSRIPRRRFRSVVLYTVYREIAFKLIVILQMSQEADSEAEIKGGREEKSVLREDRDPK